MKLMQTLWHTWDLEKDLHMCVKRRDSLSLGERGKLYLAGISRSPVGMLIASNSTSSTPSSTRVPRPGLLQGEPCPQLIMAESPSASTVPKAVLYYARDSTESCVGEKFPAGASA